MNAKNIEIPLFVVLVGLPACGKSELAEDMAKEYNAHVVSSDAVRKELYGDNYIYNPKDNTEVFSVLHNKITTLLRNGMNVIYDATNIKMKTRMNIIKRYESIPCKKICCVVIKPIEACIVDNYYSENDFVSTEELVTMYSNFEIPYYYEGWDNIKVIWNGRITDSTRSLFRTVNNSVGLTSYIATKKYNNNTYKYNVGESCIKAHKLAKESNLPKALCSAALFSEIGYPYMVKYPDTLKNKSWDRMSAYDSLFYSCISYSGILRFISEKEKTQQFCLHVAALIQWKDYDITRDKASIANLNRIFGDEFIKELHTLQLICNEARSIFHI